MSDEKIIELPSPNQCEHKQFSANCQVNWETDENGKPKSWTMATTVTCRDCNVPFSFKGALKESSDAETEATTDQLGMRAMLPIRPLDQVYREFMAAKQATMGPAAIGSPAEQETEVPKVTPRKGKQ